MKNKLKWILLCAFSAIFLIGSTMTVRLLLQARQESSLFEDLASLVTSPAESQSAPAADATTPGTQLSPYLSLQEENPDFFGWVSIDGTELHYPVMFTPEDPEYYLRRDFYGERSLSGVPFLDGDYREGCGHYLIYGHNMDNGSMFATLLSYATAEFWQEHPTIRFDTLTESGTYEVLAAFYAQVYPTDTTGGFRYYQYTALDTPAQFDAYLAEVKAAALYDTGVEAEYGDQLLTLSTCSYHVTDGRFVVVARKEGP